MMRPDEAGARHSDARLGIGGLCAVVFVCAAPANGELIGIEALERYLWIAVDVAAVLFLLQRRERLTACLLGNPALIAWPVVALASATWSLTPGISFYHGLQLLMTILAGAALRSAYGLDRLVKIIFLGLFLAAFLSVAAVIAAPRTAIGLGNEWLGIYPHKNVLGSMMALEMICAACLFLAGWRRALTAAGFLGALLLLYQSRSATALVAAVIGLAPLAMVAAWVRGRAVTGIAIGLSIVLASVAAWVVASYGTELTSAALVDLGKDRTLTGRTLLWQFGVEQFWREPWLGIGYKAYWESPATSAGYLHYSIRQKLWFFHNNILDVAVAFGIVGLAAFITGFVTSVRRTMAAFAAAPGYVEALPMLFCGYVALLACFENVLFQNHSLNQMLLAALTPLAVTAPLRHRIARRKPPIPHLVPEGAGFRSRRSRYSGRPAAAGVMRPRVS